MPNICKIFLVLDTKRALIPTLYPRWLGPNLNLDWPRNTMLIDIIDCRTLFSTFCNLFIPTLSVNNYLSNLSLSISEIINVNKCALWFWIYLSWVILEAHFKEAHFIHFKEIIVQFIALFITSPSLTLFHCFLSVIPINLV